MGKKKLIRWMNKKRLKGTELAYLLRVTGSMISQIRHGVKRPSLKLAVAIESLTDGYVPVKSWVRKDEKKKMDLH